MNAIKNSAIAENLVNNQILQKISVWRDLRELKVAIPCLT